MAEPATVFQGSREKLRRGNKIFGALSDGTRRGILRLLEGNPGMTVGSIVEEFTLSQPTISRHLSILKEAVLVVDSRVGQNVEYRLTRGGATVLPWILAVEG